MYSLIGFFNPNSMWDGQFSLLMLFSIFTFFFLSLLSLCGDGSGDSQWLFPGLLSDFSVFSAFTEVLFWEFPSLVLYSSAWLRMILSLIVRQSFVKSIVTLNFFYIFSFFSLLLPAVTVWGIVNEYLSVFYPISQSSVHLLKCFSGSFLSLFYIHLLDWGWLCL